jgi:hypothetical protein
VLSFLHRSNAMNRILGKWRHRLMGPPWGSLEPLFHTRCAFPPFCWSFGRGPLIFASAFGCGVSCAVVNET